MACSACHSQALLATCRALAKCSLISGSLSRPFAAATSQPKRHQRRISSSAVRLYRPSQTRSRESVSPALEQVHDDQYIPFDTTLLKNDLTYATLGLKSVPSAVPPPSPVAIDRRSQQPEQALENVEPVEPALDEPSVEITKIFSGTSNLQGSTSLHTASTRHDSLNRSQHLIHSRSRGLDVAGYVEVKNNEARGARGSLKNSMTHAGGRGSRSTPAPEKHSTNDRESPDVRREHWQTYKDGIKAKLGEQNWNPKKRVSPDAMEGIRAMHAQYPDRFTTPVLAKEFSLSADAIRRILKSKWRPNADEEDERRQRWDRRGERIWSDLVEEGYYPPKRWRQMGIGGGPRRPAQDKNRTRVDKKMARQAEKELWVRSLAQRLR